MAGNNHGIKKAIRTFENVAQFIYLGMVVTNQNLFEEIKMRMNMGNACYHSVRNPLSSCLLSRNIKIRLHRTIILPVVLYEFETWYLTLGEEHRLRAFGNRVMRRMFGPKRVEVKGGWRRLYNELPHKLYSVPSIIITNKSRTMRLAGHVAQMGLRGII
jgi:hypothetical protein